MNFGKIVVLEHHEAPAKAAAPEPSPTRQLLGERYKHTDGLTTVEEATRFLDRTLYSGYNAERAPGSAKRVKDASGLKGKANPEPLTLTNDYAGFRKWLKQFGYSSETFADTEWYRLRQFRVNELSAFWLAEATKQFYELTKYARNGAVVKL